MTNTEIGNYVNKPPCKTYISLQHCFSPSSHIVFTLLILKARLSVMIGFDATSKTMFWSLFPRTPTFSRTIFLVHSHKSILRFSFPTKAQLWDSRPTKLQQQYSSHRFVVPYYMPSLFSIILSLATSSTLLEAIYYLCSTKWNELLNFWKIMHSFDVILEHSSIGSLAANQSLSPCPFWINNYIHMGTNLWCRSYPVIRLPFHVCSKHF